MADITREDIALMLSGWHESARTREVEAVMAGDRYDDDPLKAAGFRLRRFDSLGTVVLGPDGKCICTKLRRCLNVDRRDGNRCSESDLEKLNDEAYHRRAYQCGGD